MLISSRRYCCTLGLGRETTVVRHFQRPRELFPVARPTPWKARPIMVKSCTLCARPQKYCTLFLWNWSKPWEVRGINLYVCSKPFFIGGVSTITMFKHFLFCPFLFYGQQQFSNSYIKKAYKNHTEETCFESTTEWQHCFWASVAIQLCRLTTFHNHLV